MGRLPFLLLTICNLRVFVVAIAVWAIVVGSYPQWLSWSAEEVNQTSFRLGLHFSDLPPPRTQITVIHVPDLEYERWLVDLPGAGQLLQLLELFDSPSQSSGDGVSTVLGLVLEAPIALIQPEVESILAEIQRGRTTEQHLYQEASEVLARRSNVLTKLKSKNVVIGVEGHRPSRYRAMTLRMGDMGRYPEFVLDWLWPNPNNHIMSTVSPILDYFPIVGATHSKQSKLLSIRQQSNFIPSFWARYIMASKAPLGVDVLGVHSDPLVWERDRGLVWGEHVLRASPTGSIVPIYGPLSGIQASLRQISLAAALARDDLSGWVLVGRDSSDQLAHSAQILASLGDDAVMLEPIWWSPLQKFLFLLLAAYMVLLIPRLSHRRAFWGGILIGIGFVFIQVVGQVLAGLWLPNGMLLLFLFSGHGLMILSLLNRRRWRRLISRADNSDLVLAGHLLNQGVVDEPVLESVFGILRRCQSSDVILDKLYGVGLALEELESETLALDVFKNIRRRKWRYLDVGKRIRRLKSQVALAGPGGQAARDVDSAAPETLLLERVVEPDQTLVGGLSSKAAFGRYEIERELGRGASGTVYLGFDPLISRQVAIKTLNYQQFSKTEIEQVKARFVCEAEAAGSLSHPNIVPVFDVGEEGGAAYIAMDFAKGSPLSNFISEDSLLPIFEVYRITLAIAEALEYAHTNKIVHRDIKPGNVLYSSEPFEVKVTDFGIARFIDKSQTRTGEILGSPLYMAPEQILGKKVVYSADIFSLGVMFYQLMTGVLPFDGDSLAGLTYDIVHTKHKGARTVRRELPASATRITNVALQKKAEERYLSASAMADALRKAMKRDFSADVKSSACFS